MVKYLIFILTSGPCVRMLKLGEVLVGRVVFGV